MTKNDLAYFTANIDGMIERASMSNGRQDWEPRVDAGRLRRVLAELTTGVDRAAA
jgi:hypothetical protein